MNILIINYEYPPLGGGGGVAAANLAREFAARGHSVDYVTTHYKGLRRHEIIDGVSLWREPVWGRKDLQTASITSMLMYPLVAIWRALKLAKVKRYDVINTHFAIPSGPAGWVLSKLLKTPNVLSVHGGDIYDPSKPYSPHRHRLLHFAVRRVLKQATFIVPQSTDTKNRTESMYGIKERIHMIPLGFMPNKFMEKTRHELGLPEDAICAIAVSRLIARKAYRDLLKAISLAGIDNLQLLIIGDGPEEDALKGYCAALGISQHARFLGRLDEEEKYQYLSVCDVFVLSPLHEGFGIVFQEAMYCGLPIVTTNVGGQKDFLKDGHNALLCDPRDVESLARSIRKIALDAKLRKFLGENNRREIQRYYIENIASDYLDIFQAAARG